MVEDARAAQEREAERLRDKLSGFGKTLTPLAPRTNGTAATATATAAANGGTLREFSDGDEGGRDDLVDSEEVRFVVHRILACLVLSCVILCYLVSSCVILCYRILYFLVFDSTTTLLFCETDRWLLSRSEKQEHSRTAQHRGRVGEVVCLTMKKNSCLIRSPGAAVNFVVLNPRRLTHSTISSRPPRRQRLGTWYVFPYLAES